MSFWGELKRRNVYKVGVAYAIVAWLLIQAASIIFPHLNLPSWAVTLVIVILIIGLPIALLLAWAYEVTPNGIKRTKQVPFAESITHLTGQKLNYIVTGLLVIAVGFLVVKDFYFDRRAVQEEVVTKVPEQVPSIDDAEKDKKTIAVLPFVDISPEKDQESLVDGLSEEIINSLTQIPDLTVIARTSSFTFKNSDKTVQEIASVLGVDNVLEGSVRKSGNALRITAQLVKAVDDSHLWSKTYDKEFKAEEMFSVQEDIANNVADKLKLTLEAFNLVGGTDNVEAYEHYLVAKGLQLLGPYGEGLNSIDRAITLDPKFALAWVIKANITSMYVIIEPDKGRHTSLLDTGLNASLRAIELEANLAAGHASLGQYRTMRSEWTEAELSYRKAFELATEPVSVLVPQIPMHYMAVGYLERAKELFEEIRQNDPLNDPNRGWYINCLGLLGDIQGAKEENELGRAIGGDLFLNLGFLDFVLVGTRDVVSREDIVYSSPIFDVAKENLDSPADGLSELHRLYTDEDNLNSGHYREISQWAAYFGDPEFAIEAIEKAYSLDATLVLFLWYPKMHDVRQFPRFKEFVREIGLVDYWNKFGWPDICHQLDNGDFECD